MNITTLGQTGMFGKRTSIQTVDRYDRTTDRVLSIGEFKKQNGLTGRQGKEEYAKYRRQAGRRGRTFMMGMISEHDLLLKSAKQTKDGWNFCTVTRASLEPKLTKREKADKEAQSADQVLKATSMQELMKSLAANPNYTKEQILELVDMLAMKADAMEAVEQSLK